jgi:hypothetical protein
MSGSGSSLEPVSKEGLPWDERLDKWPIPFYCLFIGLVWITVFVPIGLPVPIDYTSQQFYDYLEGLPADSVILYSGSVGRHSFPELGSGAEAVYAHLMTLDVRIIFYAPNVDAWTTLTDIIYVDKGTPTSHGFVYGTDYVELGIVPGAGDEVIAGALLSGFATAVPTDVRGTPTGNLPLIQAVPNGNNVKCFIYFSGLPPADVIRQVNSVWGVDFLMVAQALIWIDCVGFMGAGRMVSALNSQRGGAEYELLIGQPSIGLKATDMISLTYVAILALPIIRNIIYFARKFTGGS